MTLKSFKYFLPFFLTMLFSGLALKSLYAQALKGKELADSLLNEIKKTNSDTDRIKLLARVARVLSQNDPGTAMHYADSALHLAQQNHWPKGLGIAYLNKARIYKVTSDNTAGLENAGKAYEIFNSLNWKAAMGEALGIIANHYEQLGKYSNALENNFKALGIFEEAGLEANIAWTLNNIGADYYRLDNYPKAIENYTRALVLQKKVNDKYGIASALDNLASVYGEMGESIKVNEYNLQALKIFEEIQDGPSMGRIYINRGNYLQEQNRFDSAFLFYRKALSIAEKLGIKTTLVYGNAGIGELYFNLAQNGTKQYAVSNAMIMEKPQLLQKAGEYFSRAFEISKKTGDLSLMMRLASSLSETEELKGNYKAALHFYEASVAYKDSIFNGENERKIAALENERLAEKKDKEIQLLNKEKALLRSEQEKKLADEKRVKNLQYFAIAGLGLIVLAVVLIAMIQYRNNRQKQKANLLLQQQKMKVEMTLAELESTQSQLIQSAKMASLGELTAGIAHEIQNPLNFVNNFSEVNKELIDELKTEANKGNVPEVISIAGDISLNQEKIIHHGKRADAIVKSMLQHSRESKGMKEPIGINALAEEYLRLAFHGMKSKNKEFNASVKTDLDPAIGKIDIIPQEFGRVLLNLYNNAFYAVQERSRLQQQGYEPEVSVSTKKMQDKVEIRVKDNGKGIPQNIIHKIFQPFFTTKPTGEGTGLGLSLSYDIIKAHGGKLNVETKEGEGTQFIIQV